ncbi:cell wall-binding repeat-containing protein [Herbiconiux sp. A18JL235]|uniref:Cell wall-binding repeat-containing protein n=1 Tax=Herbiconiux sp. A18JL235 TaxID=3152363 RepID=A0AB39BES4_9MICO
MSSRGRMRTTASAGVAAAALLASLLSGPGAAFAAGSAPTPPPAPAATAEPSPATAPEPPTSAAPATDTAEADAPTGDVPTPATEAPTTDAPAPATEAPTTDAPTPATGAPTTDAPAPATDAPTTDAPTPATGAPTGAPAADTPTPRDDAPGPAIDAQAPEPTAEPTPEPRSSDEFPGDLSPLASFSTQSFTASDIVSDRHMFTGGELSAAEVQAFLQQQVPTCRDGYTCLKDYRVTTTTIAKSDECKAYQGASNESAATIISKVGVACGVSEKALLTLIQKESQLVEDDWPVKKQYDQATGFDCPDSAPCNPDYAGFFKQVYWAAWQLENYRIKPDQAQYRVGQTAPVLFFPGKAGDTCNPTSALNLTFRTAATAALYNYTPYQPNAAALAPGDGDACSSFGNLNFWGIYTDWFGYAQVDVDRVSGADRYSGAVAIAKAAYPGTAPVVYVASGQNYPDALSAGPAAAAGGGPLLLTDPASLPQSVADAIRVLAPKRIVVVGGTNSVSDAVKTRLAGLVPGVKVDRLGGASRYATSLLLVKDAFKTGASGAYLATGANFPDALSAGGAAGSKSQPVVLVDGSAGSLDASTTDALRGLGVSSLTIVGGVNSVSTGVENSAKAITPGKVTRASGADRYATSRAVNAAAYTSSDRAFLATGANFPDALAGSAWAGAAKAPLWVVPGTCVPTEVRTSLKPLGVVNVTLLGGPNSLAPAVESLSPC